MSRIPILIKLGVFIGLSVFDPISYLINKDIHHQDHEAHEEEDHELERKKKVTIQN